MFGPTVPIETQYPTVAVPALNNCVPKQLLMLAKCAGNNIKMNSNKIVNKKARLKVTCKTFVHSTHHPLDSTVSLISSPIYKNTVNSVLNLTDCILNLTLNYFCFVFMI